MKNIVLGMLLISGQCSFAKDKPEPAFKEGAVTAIAAYGSQKMFGVSGYDASRNITACVEYQLSHRFNVGMQYSYNYYETKLFRTHYEINGIISGLAPTYQIKRWAWVNILLATADYCYLNRGRTSLSCGLGMGIFIAKNKEHIIDSVGISTHRTFPVKNLAVQLQFVNAKVRLTENLGLYAGLGLGYRGILSLGAHYTFTGRK